MDFSFKYLQKRNIRKEKHHQNQTQYSLKHHPYPDSGSHKVCSQSSRNAFAGSLRSPSQSFPNPKTRLLYGIIPNYKKRRHPHPRDIPTEESYPPYPPFLFLLQPIMQKHQSQRQYFLLPPCPISHKRRRIDIKAQKRANGIIPHQLPHLDYKTRNKAATIKKRGMVEHHNGLHQTKAEHQTPMHSHPNKTTRRRIQIPMHTKVTSHNNFSLKTRCRCIQKPIQNPPQDTDAHKGNHMDKNTSRCT